VMGAVQDSLSNIIKAFVGVGHPASGEQILVIRCALAADE
jgi:hypothetical protein